MAKGPNHPPARGFFRHQALDDRRARRKMIYRRAAFFIGASLCLLILTPVWKFFAGPLTSRDFLLIMVGLAACGLAWAERHKFMRCPVCAKGVMHPQDIGTTRQKLGIADHPLLRKNAWTQWYRCSQCSHREWDERTDL